MSKRNEFRGTYEVDDGYAGKSRPQHFKVGASDIDNAMSEEDLRDLYNECARDHFEQNIGIEISKEDEFLAWARGVIAERAKETEWRD